MMSINWDEIRYFKPNEKWGDVNKILPEAMKTLDDFRHFIGKPIVIHCGYEPGGHTSKSQHYLGRAFDLHIKGMNWRDQFYAAIEFGKWSGVGVYPDWNSPGLHCDIRVQEKGTRIATWTRWKGEYIGANEEVFNRLAKIKGEPTRG